MRSRLLRQAGSANPEKIWRPLIPVESFTKEPEPVVPTPYKPEVGIRWGKPAVFEFLLDEAIQKKRSSPMTIKEVERHYFENKIIDFTEEYREFVVGNVTIHSEPIPPQNQSVIIEEHGDWGVYVYQLILENLGRPKVEIEETQSWIASTDISYEELDSNGDPNMKVNVYYKFIMERYIPFDLEPRLKYMNRGEDPRKS